MLASRAARPEGRVPARPQPNAKASPPPALATPSGTKAEANPSLRTTRESRPRGAEPRSKARNATAQAMMVKERHLPATAERSRQPLDEFAEAAEKLPDAAHSFGSP